MTRLGPSHDEGPGTQPNIGPILVSEFSVCICYTAFNQCALSRGQTILQCEQLKGGQTNVTKMVQCVLLRDKQCYNMRGQIYGQDSDPNM